MTPLFHLKQQLTIYLSSNFTLSETHFQQLPSARPLLSPPSPLPSSSFSRHVDPSYRIDHHPSILPPTPSKRHAPSPPARAPSRHACSLVCPSPSFLLRPTNKILTQRQSHARRLPPDLHDSLQEEHPAGRDGGGGPTSPRRSGTTRADGGELRCRAGGVSYEGEAVGGAGIADYR